MKASALKYSILTGLAGLSMLLLALMPFHAFLTVWLASGIGHYTAVRLWKEVILFVCLIGILYLLITDSKIRSHTLPRRLVQLIVLYATVQVIWGLVALDRHSVSLKALGYGLLINLRFLVFFLVVWSTALRTNKVRAQWFKLTIIPAVIVVVFGLLEVFVLPRDFLAHFGYNATTIVPYETINHNVHYIRYMSFLRGANPLGAYLLVPFSVMSVYLVRGRRDPRFIALWLATLAMLFFTYSRAAWLGAIVVLVLVVPLTGLRSKRVRKLVYAAAPLALLVLIVGGLGLRHNTRFQNTFLHTQSHSAVASTSDAGHASALKSGIHDLVHQPLGRGPGTAGPASVYNNHPARIAENYFIQVGQETGWLGLLLFLLINVGVGYLLWLRRADPLALALFASLIGLSIVNMLSHAWADDTLAYVWWGLAGIAVSILPEVADKEKS
jgi:hypothetical protein